MTNKTYYTQRDWDRTVGYGQVPYKYSLTAKIMEERERKRLWIMKHQYYTVNTME